MNDHRHHPEEVTSPRRRRRRPRRVLVLGAGMSGLSCARELQQRNYQVLVVEARSRVGGRLKGEELVVGDDAENSSHHNNNEKKKTTTTKTAAVDLGGALIHGIDENPLYRLTQELQVPVHSVADCLLMNDSGWPIDPKEDDRISTVFNECLEESFRRIQMASTTTTTGEQQRHGLPSTLETGRTTRSTSLRAPSFGDLFRKVCKEKNAPTASPLMSWHQANLEVSCGAGFDRLGWEWNEDEPYGFDGEHVALQPSWKAVVEALAEPLDILYRAAVTKVSVRTQTTPAVEEAPKQQQQRPVKKAKTVAAVAAAARATSPPPEPTRQSKRLRGQDASLRRSNRSNKAVNRFTVDHSLPNSEPSKSSSSTSNAGPPAVQVTVTLDDEQTVVLQADAVVCTLPLGILKEGKIEFDPPLPAAKQQAIDSLGTGLLNKCALSFPHVFWQDSDFLGLAESENSSYLVLNGAKGHGEAILVFMYGGNFAEAMQDWSDEEIVQDCLAVLQKICGRRPPPVLDYCVTRWGLEQYSRMAFTYIPPGVDGFEAFSAIRTPVCNDEGVPILMFAGEHTTPFHPSTIHGAFLSGIREAYRFDCAVDPEALGHLRFSEEELYQRTFTVAEKLPEDAAVTEPAAEAREDAAAVNTTPATTTNRPKRQQHRRRGASEVMKMRSRPAAEEAASSNGGTRSPAVTPTRRSHRARDSTNTLVDPDAQDSDDEKAASATDAVDNEKRIKALEERTLSRSLESYGPDYELIHKHAIPVHSGRRVSQPGGPLRSVSHVRSQCQKLARKRPRYKQPNVGRSWIAKSTVAIGSKRNGPKSRKSR